MVLKSGLMAIILAFSVCHLHAQSPKKQAAEAYRLYADSSLESSAELYEKSLSQSPNSEYLFNLGNSYQKLGDNEKARMAYEGALNSSSSTSDLKSKAAYNLGNIDYSEQNYEEAIVNYKKALINNPQDLQASENLQIATAQLQLQEQQQQQKQQQQEQQEQESNGTDNQKQQPENAPDKEQEGANGNQDTEAPTEKAESKEQPSQSTKLSKEQAEEFFNRLNEVENQTKSRLNQDLLKEKGNVQPKKITKDW